MLRHLSPFIINRCFLSTARKLPPDPKINNRYNLITCKISKFNLSIADKLPHKSKFGTIPLASTGWKHNKAKGDYFTIYPPVADGVSAAAKNVPTAQSFDKLGLDTRIVDNLQRHFAISQCTLVQYEGIPQMLAGDHTLIAAETGCGKTLAYLVPIVQQILMRKSGRSGRDMLFNTPTALILTPGRELATQIGEVAEKLCTNLGINVNVLLGGRTKQLMLNPALDEVDLLVGTIGATSKLVTTGVYRMNQCEHVVLDEADTMLDDSFNPKLMHFLKRFPVSLKQPPLKKNKIIIFVLSSIKTICKMFPLTYVELN